MSMLVAIRMVFAIWVVFSFNRTSVQSAEPAHEDKKCRCTHTSKTTWSVARCGVFRCDRRGHSVANVVQFCVRWVLDEDESVVLYCFDRYMRRIVFALVFILKLFEFKCLMGAYFEFVFSMTLKSQVRKYELNICNLLMPTHGTLWSRFPCSQCITGIKSFCCTLREFWDSWSCLVIGRSFSTNIILIIISDICIYS